MRRHQSAGEKTDEKCDLCGVAAAAEVGKIRQLLWLVRPINKKDKSKLHVYQGEHDRQPDLNTPERRRPGAGEYCDNLRGGDGAQAAGRRDVVQVVVRVSTKDPAHCKTSGN